MKWTEDKLDILQNLEFVVVSVWRENPAMTDYTAQRAYEAAFQFYRAELRGHTPKSPAYSGLDATVYEAVKGMCEFRLGRGACPIAENVQIAPIPVEKLVDCLRELGKSVERHTKFSGRQGYLSFIDDFLP